MKDMDETTSEASWTALTKGKEKMWRLEPEGEAERPEATVPWNEVEGVSVNPEGDSRHGQVRATIARKERENQTKMEEKVDGKAPCDEGAEIQSPKIKVVDSEETQDYVRESLNLSRDKAEEISFMPSAISIPQRPVFWCDNRCSDKALRFWQFASVVVEDGKEAHTVNFGSGVLQRKIDGTGPGAVEVLAVEGSGGTESASWQIVENVGKGPAYLSCKGESEKHSEGAEKESRKDTRPMATRVSCQRISGTSKEWCGHIRHPQTDEMRT